MKQVQITRFITEKLWKISSITIKRPTPDNIDLLYKVFPRIAIAIVIIKEYLETIIMRNIRYQKETIEEIKKLVGPNKVK